MLLASSYTIRPVVPAISVSTRLGAVDRMQSLWLLLLAACVPIHQQPTNATQHDRAKLSAVVWLVLARWAVPHS